MPQSRVTFVQRLVRWRFLFIVNLLVIGFFGLTIGREFLRTHEIQKEIQYLQTESDELFARNVSLSELQTAVQTESFIEREARLKLGMKKVGEQVVVIQEQTNEQQKNLSDASIESTDPLNYVLTNEEVETVFANATKWWYYFFHKTAYNKLNTL